MTVNDLRFCEHPMQQLSTLSAINFDLRLTSLFFPVRNSSSQRYHYYPVKATSREGSLRINTSMLALCSHQKPRAGS